MKLHSKKLISLILAVVLVLGIFPMAGFAVEGEEPVLAQETPGNLTTDNPSSPSTLPLETPSTLPPQTPAEETPSTLPVETPSTLPPETPTEETPSTLPVAVDVSALSGDELYAYLHTLNGDELTAVLEDLTQNQIDSLSGIMTDDEALEWFDIQPFAPLALGASIVPFDAPPYVAYNEDDLVTSKTAVYNGNNTATITMKAFAMGELVPAGIPADIVLVLDQSYSMGSSSPAFGAGYVLTSEFKKDETYVRVGGTYSLVTKLNGNYFYDGGTKPVTNKMQLYKYSTSNVYRIDALKTAVMNFITAIAEKSSAAVPYRIAMIGYNSGVNYLTGTSSNRFLDATTDMRSIVNGLSNSLLTGTQTDKGLQAANGLFNSTIPTDKNRVVILFTDGEPRSSGSADDNVVVPIIRDALIASKEMKTTKGVTVFSVGIGTTGLDPNRNPLSNNKKDQNTFLHCVSSNYPDAQVNTVFTRQVSIPTNTNSSYYIFDYNGSEPISPIQPSGTCRQVTYSNGTWGYTSGGNWVSVTFIDIGSTSQDLVARKYHFWNGSYNSNTSYMVPGTRSNVKDSNNQTINFYKTAANSSALDSLFQGMSEILTGGISGITVKDYLMPQFEGIMNGSTLINITATVGSTAVPFSYDAANRLLTVGPVTLEPVEVDDDEVPDPTQLAAKQLVITWTVNVKADFIGGNNVVTNALYSGVYDSGGRIEDFDRPEVNVPLRYDLFDLNDQNVYVGDNATITKFFATDTYRIVNTDYTYDANNNGYVDIIYTIKDAADHTVGTYTVPYGTTTGTFVQATGYTLEKLTNDTYYKVTVSVSVPPSLTGEGASGAPVTTPITNKNDTVNVFVYKPVISVKDLAVYLTNLPDLNSAVTGVVWKHNGTDAPAAMGTAPALTYTFTYTSPVTDYPTGDTGVNITGVKRTVIDYPIAAANYTVVNASGVDTAPDFNVYVYKPVVTATDAEVFLGETTNLSSRYSHDNDTGWYATLGAPAKPDTAPNLTLTPALVLGTALPSDITAYAPIMESDFTVNVVANGKTITDKTKFITAEYSGGVIGIPTLATNGVNHHFTIHVKTGTLTITKRIPNNADAPDPGESFLFTITVDRGSSSYTFNEVISAIDLVDGVGSKVITGLPKGTYTVTEDTNWSWRYNTVSDTAWDDTEDAYDDQTLGRSITDTSIQCTVTNSSRTPFWLSWETFAPNKFN